MGFLPRSHPQTWGHRGRIYELHNKTRGSHKSLNFWMNIWKVTNRGLRSCCRQVKLTTGICKLVGRQWSLASFMVLPGSSGERRGERIGERRPRPSLPTGATLGSGECSPSDPEPSSSSLMDGSFVMMPPLLSQSTWGMKTELNAMISFKVTALYVFISEN